MSIGHPYNDLKEEEKMKKVLAEADELWEKSGKPESYIDKTLKEYNEIEKRKKERQWNMVYYLLVIFALALAGLILELY